MVIIKEISMSIKFTRINYIALVLLVMGGLIHYLIPSHPLVSNICLFLAILLHSSCIWGVARTVTYVILAMVIGYFAEFMGVHTGWVFGVYHYNAATDPGMVYGVPLFIPMIYGYLLYTGHFILLAISKKLLNKSNLLVLALLTGFLLTLKDLGTDPLHSTVAQVWIWTNGGEYFGVPIHNFIGWFGVFVVMTLITLPLTWYRNNYYQNVKLEKRMFYVPILLFSLLALFGYTAAFQVPTKDYSLGLVSAFITAFTLVPYILLAWFNGVHTASDA
jgi:putative membrane protein